MYNKVKKHVPLLILLSLWNTSYLYKAMTWVEYYELEKY